MLTIRHIERLWTNKSFQKLSQELLSVRLEGSFRLEGMDRPCFAAAVAMIRLDELSQSHLPFFSLLLRSVLSAQDRDGGWGDPATTALCVRALQLGRGEGVAVQRGLTYLANLQKEEGIWPAGPMRRMVGDPVISLFILYQLVDSPHFREAVRFGDALAWYRQHVETLTRECKLLWDWASLRCRAHGPALVAAPPSLFAA